jgi:predicted dithiol-disulfide oxidoreductase (DUF899 family)
MNTATVPANTVDHPVVSPADWTAQRRQLLAREKELTRLGDQIAQERRALPWVRIAKSYIFDTPDGPRSLADLFDGRRQLMVQHFMLAPGWEQGCKSCSFMTDHLAGAQTHLQQRDLTVALVSRASLPEIERFRRRMGWPFKWVSAKDNDFNLDFHVSFPPETRVDGEVVYNYARTAFPQEEAPGISFFFKDDAGGAAGCRRGLPHLLDLRSRRRSDDGHVPPAGHGAQGPRRGPGRVRHGMGAPPRSLRAGSRGRTRRDGILLRRRRLTRSPS